MLLILINLISRFQIKIVIKYSQHRKIEKIRSLLNHRQLLNALSSITVNYNHGLFLQHISLTNYIQHIYLEHISIY